MSSFGVPQNNNQPARPFQQASRGSDTLSGSTVTTIVNPAPATNNRESSRTTDEAFATLQVRERANLILDNYDLLMRYASANDLSVPRTRLYFEKVAAGFSPKPVIKNWYPLS